MTAKTDNFKNTQIPLWEDGDLANGANFSQLINAIATLVNDTKAETLTEASQASGSGIRTEMAKIPAYSVKSYTFSGSTVTIEKTDNTTQTIALTAGASYLQATTEALLAECINAAGTKFLLTRADGAKILVDSSTKTAKPAAALIG